MAAFATLGDKLMSAGNSNWRAELREAGIPTRPPPPSASGLKERPDRGYVEQPEERMDKSVSTVIRQTTLMPPSSVPRRRIISFEDLERASEAPMELLEAVTAPPSALDTFPLGIPAPTTAAVAPAMAPAMAPPAVPVASERQQETLFPSEPENETGPEETSEEREISHRARYSTEYKLAAAARVAAGETQRQVADDLGITHSLLSNWCNGKGLSEGRWDTNNIRERERVMTGKVFDEAFKARAVARVLKGEKQADVARSLDTSDANISSWLSKHRKKHGGRPPKLADTGPVSSRAGNGHTMMSGPSSQALGEMPPPPAIRIEGLEEYIEGLVKRQVSVAVKAEIQKRFSGD